MYVCICVTGATWVYVCVAGAYAMGAAVCDDHSAVVAAVSASHDVLHRHCRDLRKREGPSDTYTYMHSLASFLA